MAVACAPSHHVFVLARCVRAALAVEELLIVPGRYLMTSGVQGRLKVPSERRAPDDQWWRYGVRCMSALSYTALRIAVNVQRIRIKLPKSPTA